MLDVVFLCGAAIVAVPVFVLVMRMVKFGWKRLDDFTTENLKFSVDEGAMRVTRPFSLVVQSVAIRLISSAELWFPLTRWKKEEEVDGWTSEFTYYSLDDLDPKLWQRFIALLTLDKSSVSFWRRREALRQDILSRTEVGEVSVRTRHGQWMDGNYYDPETLAVYGHPDYQDCHPAASENVIT